MCSLNKVTDLQLWPLLCVERSTEMVSLCQMVEAKKSIAQLGAPQNVHHGGAEEIFAEVMVRVRQLAQLKLQRFDLSPMSYGAFGQFLPAIPYTDKSVLKITQITHNRLHTKIQIVCKS